MRGRVGDSMACKLQSKFFSIVASLLYLESFGLLFVEKIIIGLGVATDFTKKLFQEKNRASAQIDPRPN